MIRDDAEGYIRSYDNIVEIIKIVGPAVVVFDMLFYAAHDACIVTGVQYIQMSPGSFYEVCGHQQPLAAQFWKYAA